MTINEIIRDRITPDRLSDADIQSLAYGILYFSFGDDDGFGILDHAWWRETRPLYVARLRPSTPTTDHAPDPDDRCQMWEPCEICGDEPAYATDRGHLCLRHS